MATGLELINLCVWNKGAGGGMGSFYRSAHELVFVFASAGPRINNVMLGVYGRNRTNVWDHPGAVALRGELEAPPHAQAGDAAGRGHPRCQPSR